MTPNTFHAWILAGTISLVDAGFAASRAAAAVPAPPEPAALFEQARIAPERVVYAEDFEGPDTPDLFQFYAGDTPNRVLVLGPTDEEAFRGRRSYKISIEFEPVPGKTGGAYFLLPFEIPAWSELKLKWHLKVKVEPEAKLYPFHGFTGGDLEAREGHNVAPYVGEQTGTEDGWQVWEATARKTGRVGERVEGAAVYFQIGAVEVPTTVTYYVDAVTVRGGLPVNWQELWDAAAHYFREFAEKDKRASAAGRLAAARDWEADIVRRRAGCGPLEAVNPLLAEQYQGTIAAVDELLGQARAVMAAVTAALAEAEAPFAVNINAAERHIAAARYRLRIAEACREYAADAPDGEFLTFALDGTQSYAILPSGPDAHVEEHSYYGWSQRADSFENPQLLPETWPVPAPPGRVLANFGCRGLFVPFSFAVRAGQDLDGLVFTASDLTCAAGTIPASAVDLRVVGVWYRPYGGKLRLMNEPLFHDPRFAVPVPGENRNEFKDPLYGDDTPELLPVRIAAGTTRQFYALVRVPADATAGLYRGVVEGTTVTGQRIPFGLELEVMPFDLEPTPFAYSAFYRSYLADPVTKRREGIHSKRKTPAQMQAELINMAEHGMNTLNLYIGNPRRTDSGWDFSELEQCLAMAKRAGLTRSPFTWLGHGLNLEPVPGRKGAETLAEVLAGIASLVPAVNRFCAERGYPQPAFFGADERSGDELARLGPGYEAVNAAGGLLTVACYSDYWANVGTAISLPIVFGGAVSASARHAIRQSQSAGLEVWIYNCPSTNMPATPSAYRRRYGLALWRLGENGAAPWEYSGVHYTASPYVFEPDTPMYAFAFPTWSGKPIDSIIFEAFREGIYDTRYATTLEAVLQRARLVKVAPARTAAIEEWLAAFSVNDDLQSVRRQMADFLLELTNLLETR